MKNWTDEEDKRLALLFWKGLTDYEISQHFHSRTKGAVKERRMVLDLIRNKATERKMQRAREDFSGIWFEDHPDTFTDRCGRTYVRGEI